MHLPGTASKDVGARPMILLHAAHAATGAMERLPNASLQFQLFGDDCKYAHAPPGFSRLTASIREVLQSQLKIQTFFQERCTWLNSPCIFSQDCWARGREFATLLNHLPLVDPDTIAWQKIPQQDSLRLPFPKKMIMQSGSKQEHCQ